LALVGEGRAMPRAKASIDYLASVTLFRDLSQAQLRKVARLTDVVEVSPGRTVLREGTYRSSGGPAFFLVVDGEADVTIRRRNVGRLRPGQSFGEMSLLDGKPRAATVTARTPMLLYRIRSWDFHALVRREPTVALCLLKTVAARLRKAEEPKRRG
jgi:CRP-like cAMP-binding protein